MHRNALVRLEAVRELSPDDEVGLPGGRTAVSRSRIALRRALGL